MTDDGDDEQNLILVLRLPVVIPAQAGIQKPNGTGLPPYSVGAGSLARATSVKGGEEVSRNIGSSVSQSRFEY